MHAVVPGLAAEPFPVASAVASPPAELPAEVATPPSMQGLADQYAVVDIGGVQHIVEEGRWYTCNRLAVSTQLKQHPPGDSLL